MIVTAFRVLLLLALTSEVMLPQIRDIVVTTATNYEQGLPPKGSIATLFCRGLKGIDGIVAASTLPLPRELAGVRVKVGGGSAPLFAVAAFPDYQQINFQVPQEAAFLNNQAEIRVEQGQETATMTAALRPPPGDFFRLDGTFAIIQRATDWSLITRDNPARPGDHLVAYLTGLPGTQPIVPTGEAAPTAPLAIVPREYGPAFYEGYNVHLDFTFPPNGFPFAGTVTMASEIEFLGLSPGSVGLYQLNFDVPKDAAALPAPLGPMELRIKYWRCQKVIGTVCPGGPSIPRQSSPSVLVPFKP